jgi:hypothetical protein
MAESLIETVAAWVAEALMPQLLGDGGEADMGAWSRDRVQVAIRFTAQDHPLCSPILNREATIANSMLTGLSRHKVLTDMRFFRRLGATRILRRAMGEVVVGSFWWPVSVTASDEPLPTTMREVEQGVREERLPDEE